MAAPDGRATAVPGTRAHPARKAAGFARPAAPWGGADCGGMVGVWRNAPAPQRGAIRARSRNVRIAGTPSTVVSPGQGMSTPRSGVPPKVTRAVR